MDKTDFKIAELRCEGFTNKEIGKEVGLSTTQVGRRLNKDDVIDLIDSIQHTLIMDNLPIAAQNVQYAIQQYQTVKDDPQLRDHGFKASESLMKSVGLLPGDKMSITYQNIVNNNQIISPMVDELISLHFGIKMPQDRVLIEEGGEVKDAVYDSEGEGGVQSLRAERGKEQEASIKGEGRGTVGGSAHQRTGQKEEEVKEVNFD